jgi:hypothetical protein
VAFSCDDRSRDEEEVNAPSKRQRLLTTSRSEIFPHSDKEAQTPPRKPKVALPLVENEKEEAEGDDDESDEEEDEDQGAMDVERVPETIVEALPVRSLFDQLQFFVPMAIICRTVLLQRAILRLMKTVKFLHPYEKSRLVPSSGSSFLAPFVLVSLFKLR